MNVLIAGGTGFIGKHLCNALYDRGHEVTALSRSPGDSGLPDSVTTVRGDITEYDSIIDHFADQTVVVNLVALTPLFRPKGGEQRHTEVHVAGTENVIRAASASGGERLIQQSALGADPSGPTAYIRAKGLAEAAVERSDLDWVIIRPSIVFGEGGEFLQFTKKLTTPYITGLPGGGRTRFQPIWIGEFVRAMCDAIEERQHVGNVYEIGGPEVLTLADVARLIYRAEGRSLRIIPVPMAVAKLALTLAWPIPFIPFGPDQYRGLQFENTTDENAIEKFGMSIDDLTTLSEYLAM